MAYRLLLIRHGQTAHNVENRYTGWGDPPLTDTGLHQAELLAEHLGSSYHLNRLYTSPLNRCQQTALAIARAYDQTAEIRPNLKELYFGHIEGLTLEEARSRFPGMQTFSQALHDITFAYPGGERLVDFFWRIRRAILDTMVPPEGTVAVVTHGGVIAAYLAYAVNDSPLRWVEYSIDNCSVTELEVSGRRSRLVRLNDTSFLSADTRRRLRISDAFPAPGAAQPSAPPAA